MDRAVRSWAETEVPKHPEVVRLGYFGSYARGDWSVGSDLDLIAVVTTSREPFERRPLTWPLEELPVPAELLVYTVEEWERLQKDRGRLARVLEREAVWIVGY
ncbi:MAG: nucleotidyltransferase domain-containing protein [Deferrisomatales bacterium]